MHIFSGDRLVAIDFALSGEPRCDHRDGAPGAVLSGLTHT